MSEHYNKVVDDSTAIRHTAVKFPAGRESLYNHGNQPGLHIPRLFNYSGKPWLTQKWVRAICNEFYGTEGVHSYGYGQDEDQGRPGAWYVASMDLFDVQGDAAEQLRMQPASPLFDKITIRLDKTYHPGEKLSIVTHNNFLNNIHIKRARLNGNTSARPVLNSRTW